MPCGKAKYAEADLLPIAALQHLTFCERQFALIYIEQSWLDNRLTAEGRLLHERVHDASDETRGDVRVARGLRLRSFRLGLTGQADVVEFHRQPDRSWIPFPVEYKRGRPKPDRCDEVQLCAQALCLEEMLGVTIRVGAIFYGVPRRRHVVEFTEELRLATEQAARRAHELFAAGQTPAAVLEPKCEQCSIRQLCMPETAGRGKSARRYLSGMLAE